MLNGQERAGPAVPPLINHTPPTYIADANYSETIDGVLVIYLTTTAIQNFWEVTLSLAPKHINALRAEEITHSKDLLQFNSKEFEMVIRSMKGKAALPDLAQIWLKQIPFRSNRFSTAIRAYNHQV